MIFIYSPSHYLPIVFEFYHILSTFIVGCTILGNRFLNLGAHYLDNSYLPVTFTFFVY